MLVSLAVCGALLLCASLWLRSAQADAPLPPRLNAKVLDIHLAPTQAFLRQIGEDNVVIGEFAPAEDTFVAQKPPYDTRVLGKAQSLLVGTEENLGVTRTFLNFDRLHLPANAEIRQVVLALGIAGGSDDLPLAIEVAPTVSCFYFELGMTWHTQLPVATPWFVTVVMTRGKWYLYDITPFVSFRQNVDSTISRERICLRIRALEEPASGWKGMWSREGNVDLAPHVLVAYVPDTTPPTCTLNSPPPVLYGGDALTGRAKDDRAAEVIFEFQIRAQGGEWQKLRVSINRDPQTGVFTAIVNPKEFRGQEVFIRCRAWDRAGNVGPWSSPVQTRVYGRPPHIRRIIAPDLVGDVGLTPIRVEFSHPRPDRVYIDDWRDLQVREYPDGEWQRKMPVRMERLITPTEGVGVITLFVDDYRAGADIQYRVRLRDKLDNVSEWHETPPARVYGWIIRAHIKDIRGLPLDVFPHVEPADWIVRPVAPHAFDIYGWGSKAYTITYATRDRVLMSKRYGVHNRVKINLESRVGINDNAVRNGEFAEGLSGWQTFVSTPTVEHPWDGPPYLRIDLSPDAPPILESGGEIAPFGDKSLLVWYEWAVWRVDYHGRWEKVLDIPPMPNARVIHWVVPNPVTDTLHALLITERDGHPRDRTYLFEWNPEVGATSLITLTQTRLTNIDEDAKGRIHLLWWDGTARKLVYRLWDGEQWHQQYLPTGRTRTSHVVVLALNDTVWALHRDGSHVCWHTSTDAGMTWGDEQCQEFPALAHFPSREWAFRAGSNGPFIFDGETLRAWDGATWTVWGDHIQGSLVGCPDGTVRGIGSEGPWDSGRVYTLMWDANGHFSGPHVIARDMKVFPRWLWCSDEDFGAYSAVGLVRVWRVPQFVPLLAQVIHVPKYRPMFGFVSFVPGFRARWQILATPLVSGSQHTIIVYPQAKLKWETYSWADLSPVADQVITMTLGLSTTVYPLFGSGISGVARIRDVQVRSQPYDVVVRQAVRPLDDAHALLRLWVQNRRPAVATQLRLGLTWSVPYTLTSLSVPFVREGASQVALEDLALEPRSTLYITGMLEVTGTVPTTGWVRAWITPTVVDMRPSDNMFDVLFVSRPRTREYLSLLFGH